MQLPRDPNAAYAFVILGLLAVYLELLRPGLILPGVTGAALAMLGVAAFAERGVQPAGLVLILLATLAMWLGVRAGWPATLAAAALLPVGARFLVAPPRISWLVAAGLSVPFVWITSWLAGLAMRARWNKLTF